MNLELTAANDLELSSLTIYSKDFETLARKDFDIDECQCNCLLETEGLFKVTGTHVYRISGNISETVQDRDAVTTDY